MKYVWMILIIIMLAGIGVGYIFTDILNYFIPKPSKTEIVVASPEVLE